MSTILGMLDTETFANERFKNIRRSVFYFFPNGASPLIGILSMLKEEVCNDPEFKWYEKYLAQQSTTSAAISGNVCLYSTVSSDFGTWTTAAADFTMAADSQYGLKVASTSPFRVGHVIKFNVIVSAAAVEVQGHVTKVDTDNTRLAFTCIKATSANLTYNSASGIGVEVLVIGHVASEGQVGTSYNPYNQPLNPYNYCTISRTAWTITGSALKTSIKYDETGAYKDQAKDASINHMREMEFASLFMERHSRTNSRGEVERFTGGILWYLRQWEAADSIYRGGSGASAITANSDDDKRLITLSDGYITDKLYNTYLERVFRITNNKTNEKLVLCGSGFLNVINQLYQSRACLTTDMPLTATYGMNVVKHVTPFGTIYYKSHPLFNLNPTLRNNALFLEVMNLKYRYLSGRDTELLTERQPNNADYREDEYLTEWGLELQTPQSALYLQNVLDFK